MGLFQSHFTDEPPPFRFGHVMIDLLKLVIRIFKREIPCFVLKCPGLRAAREHSSAADVECRSSARLGQYVAESRSFPFLRARI